MITHVSGSQPGILLNCTSGAVAQTQSDNSKPVTDQ
jgi:hypothetical protein